MSKDDSTACHGVCQIKSSLLVGLVLLIILISGLCCMAGIDTRQDLKLLKNLKSRFLCIGQEYLNTCGACDGSKPAIGDMIIILVQLLLKLIYGLYFSIMVCLTFFFQHLCVTFCNSIQAAWNL